MNNKTLEQIAELRKIRIHEPFSEFLKSDPLMHSFEISLLDCYRMAGHACHAITGAFLVTEAAIESLFPETRTCERGDLMVEFGSSLDERATGPRSNVISFITGAWGDSGFPGLKGKFKRKDLISYGHADIEKNAVRFRRLSNGKIVTVQYDPSNLVRDLGLQIEFPESWRAEICAILNSSGKVLKFLEPKVRSSGRTTAESNGSD
ncbi:MAG: hypothetical protein COT73_02260 [Bdellovibrio sp. CG10_big_fil_rev_8_21_14_0_10_47_8]|nr:MAG: hypothetical protein COT73_02260 [Bdellovibrio sp. CG10_big_fil_rev_8_21_14_0_10_47_8]